MIVSTSIMRLTTFVRPFTIVSNSISMTGSLLSAVSSTFGYMLSKGGQAKEAFSQYHLEQQIAKNAYLQSLNHPELKQMKAEMTKNLKKAGFSQQAITTRVQNFEIDFLARHIDLTQDQNNDLNNWVFVDPYEVRRDFAKQSLKDSKKQSTEFKKQSARYFKTISNESTNSLTYLCRAVKETGSLLDETIGDGCRALSNATFSNNASDRNRLR